MRLAIAIAVLIPVAAGAAPVEHRDRYIGDVLGALRSMTPAARRDLARDVRIAARKQCRADSTTPDAMCVVAAVRKLCAARPEAARRSCALSADVIAINFLAEKEWVERKTRVRIMNTSDDFQAGMRAELRARYAGLVAELSMMRGFSTGATMAGDIDRFCVARARRRVLTWSRCVGAIVWYITEPASPKEAP